MDSLEATAGLGTDAFVRFLLEG